jgi:hypothetical protein
MMSFALYSKQRCGELNNTAMGRAFLDTNYLEDGRNFMNTHCVDLGIWTTWICLGLCPVVQNCVSNVQIMLHYQAINMLLHFWDCCTDNFIVCNSMTFNVGSDSPQWIDALCKFKQFHS